MTPATMTPDARHILAALVREVCPGESLPADDLALLIECAHNHLADWYADAEAAARGDVSAIASLRTALGLPLLGR